LGDRVVKETSLMILGLDIGSAANKAVILDESLRVIGRWKMPSRGNPGQALKNLLKTTLGNKKNLQLQIGITGAGSRAFEFPSDIVLSNEIISLALGSAHLYPSCRSAIEIGAETSRWLLLDGSQSSNLEPEIVDFAMNERCAAGTGTFLEQQAARLKLGIEEFSKLAASAQRGATVAGRCSVFAKTDMIHLQQKGTPLEEIAYGVCLALARNFMATVLKGRECLPPVLLAGGGAQNKGLIRAFREVLKFQEDEFIVSDDPLFICATGAALGAFKSGKQIFLENTENYFELLKPIKSSVKSLLDSLGDLEIRQVEEPQVSEDEFVEGYLGVDIGSVSTNLALVNVKGEVKAGVYLPTRGRPMEVLREGYELLKQRCKGQFRLLGIGTTGSGRYLAGRLLSADVISNEITCQLVSAVYYFPDVDTIFEIGGQDSKYISAQSGKIHDFTMNKICAAGTGSFLEEQAEPLGIKIEGEFSAIAAQSSSPRDLGSRCTVFMDTELVNAVNQGTSLPDITAGLAYSIVRNYLEKVVEDRPVGKKIVFQGGVASNPSVVKAFSLSLQKPIQIHPYNRISGAIGAALVAKNRLEKVGKISPDTEVLDKRIHQNYAVSSFECQHCSNHCQVNRIALEGELIYFGDTCERYTSQQDSAKRAKTLPQTVASETKIPDLFRERENLLKAYIQNLPSPILKIGLPKASFMLEYLPFWATFFNKLGCEVCVSPDSNMGVLEEGLKKLPAETCLPIKIAFGHVQCFEKKDVDWIFFPSYVDSHDNPLESVYLCPYCENVPFMAKSALEIKFLTPSVLMNSGEKDFLSSMSEVEKALGLSAANLRHAYLEAHKTQKEFAKKMKERGEQILKECETKKQNIWPVLGKPYNIHDSFLNLNLAKHLKKLKILAFPIDFIPSDSDALREWPARPPWRYSQHIIQAALWCKDKPNLYPLILSNFGCGPDAFCMKHVEKILEDTPHLFLEFDEHRAEAGLITRLEAFADEVSCAPQPARKSVSFVERKKDNSARIEEYKKRRFILPYFADHAFAFSGAMRGVGIEARVLLPPNEQTLTLGEKFSSGKECHAYSIITGDLVKFAQGDRSGGEVFYFPGVKYSCLLQQYGEGMNYLLEDLGIPDLEVVAPPADFLNQFLGYKGLKLLWRGLVAIDLLIKAACEKRPYEKRKGTTDRIHKENLKEIEEGLDSHSFHYALKRCVERLDSIETQQEWRPLIGIAGDIYTRQNPVANHDLFLKLEALGCEVWPAPFFVDDVDFSIQKDMAKKLMAHKYHEAASIGLLNLRKEIERWIITKNLKGALRRFREPTFKEIVENTSRYINLDNNETLLLNVAKMVDFAQKGADGVINAICFNCMLGTISGAIASRIRRDYKNIPIPTLIYSGTELVSEKTKLEAFVYQIQQFSKKRKNTLFTTA
jgi:predicted CoA-substrate-specific enzyme activase